MGLRDEDKKKAEDMASGKADDFDAEKSTTFAERHKNKSWYRNFKLLLEMITDQDYELTSKNWAIIAGSLAYVVIPIDLVPDFIPILGWLDDAAVLTYAVYTLNEEIKLYKAFKNGIEE